MLRARCLPANGTTAQAQLKVIDRELERVRQASPAFRKLAPKPVVRPQSSANQTPYWAIIREPVNPAPFKGLQRTRPINGPSKLQLRVQHSLTNLYRNEGQLMDKQIASSPPRLLRHSSSSSSSSLFGSSQSLSRPASASAFGAPSRHLGEGPWANSLADLQVQVQTSAPAHRQGTEDDEEGLDWRQKRALRLKKKKAAQRALLHGDDDEAAEDYTWHQKALAQTQRAHSATHLPTGSHWSGPTMEPPPVLPQFIHHKPRPTTAELLSPSKTKPSSPMMRRSSSIARTSSSGRTSPSRFSV